MRSPVPSDYEIIFACDASGGRSGARKLPMVNGR